jgi:hypothetical protein
MPAELSPPSSNALPFDTTDRVAGRPPSLKADRNEPLEPTQLSMADTAEPRWRHLEEWALGAAVAANILVALAAAYFPYQDSINHLARYYLIDRAWSGHPVDWVQVRVVPTSYIATDVVGAALVHVLGASTALKVIAVVPLLLLPGGMYALLRVTAPTQRGWALVAALLSLSWFYLGGFISYSVGMGLTLVWLAAWWPRRDERSWGWRLGLAVGGVLLFLVHLSAPLIALGVVGLDLVLTAASERGSRRALSPAVRARFVTLAVITLAVALVWMVTTAASSEVRAAVAPPEFRTPLDKLTHLAAPFYSFSMVQMALLGGSYLLALIALVAHHRRPPWSDRFWLCGLLFLLLYMISPSRASAAGDLDTRWLLPACLLPFCAAHPRPPRRLALLILLALCLTHAAVVRHYSADIDRELIEFDSVLARLPPGSRVLPLVSDQGRHGHVIPYLHFALWHVIRKHGRVPGLFSANGTRESDPAYPHFNHFRVIRPPYLPDAGWGVRTWAPLDCSRVRHDYDFVLQAGSDDRATRMIEQCAPRVLRAGEITVYRVATARR